MPRPGAERRAEAHAGQGPGADGPAPPLAALSPLATPPETREDGGGGTWGPREERLLLPLLQEERTLLADYGPEHPQVLAVRARITAVRDFLARCPVAPPRQAATTIRPAVATIPNRPTGACGARVDGVVSTTSWVGGPGPRAEPVRIAPCPKSEPVGTLAPPPASSLGGLVTPKPGGPEAAPATRTVPEARPGPTHEGRDMTERPSGAAQVTATVVQLIAVLTALLIGLVVHVLALVYILRRYGARLAPLVRVQVVGTQGPSEEAPIEAAIEADWFPPAPEESAPAPPAPESAEANLPGAEEEVESPPEVDQLSGENFDLGPTFQEEARLQQEAARQQEEAVLMQVFEQNLLLREQIEDLQVAA